MVAFFHLHAYLRKTLLVAGLISVTMGAGGQSLHAEVYAGLTPGTAAWRDAQSVDPVKTPMTIIPTVDLQKAVTLQTKYKGTLSGIDLGHVAIDTKITDRSYSLTYKVRQSGLGKRIDKGTNDAQAIGIFTDEGPVSLYYRSHEQESEDDYQHIELARNLQNNRLQLWTDPAYALDRPVSPTLTKTTLDPVSALVELGYMNAAEGKTPCERTVEVFDGKRRFDLVMWTDKKTKLYKRGKGRYEGPVWRCKVSKRKIAGYKAKDMKKKERVGFVYLVDVPDAFKTAQFRYFPVLISARRGFFSVSLEVVDPVLRNAKGEQLNLGRR